jgi:hypothetical protein
MALKFSTALRNARADAISATIGNAGVLRIYSGTRPADVGTAVTSQVLLAELVCGSPFAAAASGGVLTVGAITQDSSANNTGTASWFRFFTNGGTAVFDGDVGTSGADLNLNTLSIVAGGPVQVTSATITEGGA